MDEVCRKCRYLGVPETIPGEPLLPNECTNSNSSRFGELVGHDGDGCESWTAGSRFPKETQDI